jgi:hypothetical protein
MVSRKVTGLQSSLTLFVICLSLYCTFSGRELYPFAPFTMYSYRHSITENTFFNFFCVNGPEEIPLRNEMTFPFDDARLSTSVESSYYANSPEEVVIKLKSLREAILKNQYKCDKAVVRLVKYESTKAFLAKKGHQIKAFESGAE